MSTTLTGSVDTEAGDHAVSHEMGDGRDLLAALLVVNTPGGKAAVGTAVGDVSLPADALTTLSDDMIVGLSAALTDLLDAAAALRAAVSASGGSVGTAADVTVTTTGNIFVTGANLQETTDSTEAALAYFLGGIIGVISAISNVPPSVAGSDLLVDVAGTAVALAYTVDADSTPTIAILRIVLPDATQRRILTVDFAGLADTPTTIQYEDTGGVITPVWRGTPPAAADYAAGVRVEAISDGTTYFLARVG